MYVNKKRKTMKSASRRHIYLGGVGSDSIAVTGKRTNVNRPVERILRGMDPKTFEILVDDKIATGG